MVYGRSDEVAWCSEETGEGGLDEGGLDAEFELPSITGERFDACVS
jgi:hypothetical protein